jgi:hypothetical protein
MREEKKVRASVWKIGDRNRESGIGSGEWGFAH